MRLIWVLGLALLAACNGQRPLRRPVEPHRPAAQPAARPADLELRHPDSAPDSGVSDAQRAQRAVAKRLARYDRWQQEAARAAGIPWLAGKAVRIKESFNDPDFISTTGAVGLMQLMPLGRGKMYLTPNYRAYRAARAAANRRYRGKRASHWALAYQQDLRRLLATTPRQRLYKLDQRFDPRWNIFAGCRHLARDLKRFNKRFPRAPEDQLLKMTFAAYYTGPGRVRYHKGVIRVTPSSAEHYLQDIWKVYTRLRAGLPGR